MKKKIISLIFLIALLISFSSISYAYEFPSSFWSMNESYTYARDTKNYPNIIKYGTKIINLLESEPKNQKTTEALAPRYYDVAFAYYRTKDYDNAYKYFEKYIPYGEIMGWTDGVKIAQAFLQQLPSFLEIYKHTPNEQLYFGAKNEPHGVLYGQVSERSLPGDSMVLLYVEYGLYSDINWARSIFKQAQENGRAVELALNFPNQGSDARAITESDAFLDEVYKMVSEYPDVPVYLRIAAEVNIWDNICTPEEFKTAFYVIATRMKQLPNVATVWSIAHTDRWAKENTADMFYPGDDIVDWVGVTIYCNKHFEAQDWGDDVHNEIYFKTGHSADPVLMIQDTVEKYGSRKPIMISECGSAYYTNGEISELHHEWGADYLKRIYSYVPMVYPQVKLMAYFNVKIDDEYNWYDLEHSTALTNAYYQMTEAPWFIKFESTNRARSFFEPVYNNISAAGTFTVSAYPHLYGADSITVDYYLNDQLVASATEPPFTAEIFCEAGTHRLKVTAKGNNGIFRTRNYTVYGQEPDPTPVPTVCPFRGEDFDSTNPDNFTDISEATDDLRYVLEKRIMNGYEDGTFRPSNTLTRAEFATMVCRMMEYSTDEACTFSDAKDHWASKSIKACVDAGIINGFEGNKFAPDDNITIEQALKIVTLVAEMAEPNATYPDGFIAAAISNGLTNNLTTRIYDSALKRIDAASIIAQASK